MPDSGLNPCDPAGACPDCRSMSILPKGEQVRRAVKWISDQRVEDPEAPLYKLLEEAARRFDLSPMDCEVLAHFYADQGDEE